MTLAPSLFVSWVAALGLGLASASADAPVQERRLPQGTTSLTAEQQWHALGIAEADIAAEKLRTDERLYLISIKKFHDKNSSDLKALVTHYRTDGDLTIQHRVNLSSGRLERRDLGSNRPTALSREELEMAERLALADERVKALLGHRPGLVVEPMVIRGTPAGSPGHGHRIVRLLFKVGRDYLSRPVVFVDLTEASVSIEDKDPSGPQ